MLRMITGRPGPSGFGSATTAEQVTEGIDGSNLTPTVTGFKFILIHVYFDLLYAYSSRVSNENNLYALTRLSKAVYTIACLL